MTEYLNEAELDTLKNFMKDRNITKAKIGRLINKTPQVVNHYFKKKKFKRLLAQEFQKRLQKESLKGFEEIAFLN